MADLKDFAGQAFDRAPFESLMRRRMFFTESFEIYREAGIFSQGDKRGANRGLYDYGPPGCSLQANIVDLWRKHFVIEENMLELDCSSVTPEDVFITSGHVAKFADWMCRDPKTGDFLRADHLVEGVLEGRLKGDKAARGVAADAGKNAATDDKKKKKKIKPGEIVATKLEDNVVDEYETILAQVSLRSLLSLMHTKNP